MASPPTGSRSSSSPHNRECRCGTSAPTRREACSQLRRCAFEARRVLARAERLELLIPVGGDQYEVPSPSLLTAAEEVVARGISLEAALGIFGELDRHCDAVARAFVKLFVEQVWRPFQRADMPAERWPEIDDSIERLRPLAADALLAIFNRRMKSQIEAAFGELTQRLSERTLS